LAADGEELMAAGLRELREEAGFAPAAVTPESVRYLGAVWDNPGMGRAVSHIFAAWDLVAVGGTQRDSTEALSLHWQPVSWLKDAVRTGAIKDRVVVAALAFLMVNGYVS
jgi:8-oxo-dGTP pyrophosphatase MutT (NUDIX family)